MFLSFKELMFFLSGMIFYVFQFSIFPGNNAIYIFTPSLIENTLVFF